MDEGKRGSKGGFLQLFDLHAKPRKKLFSNKSELSEGLQNGQEKLFVSMTTESQLMDGNENGLRSHIKGNRDSGFISPSDVNNGYGARAPSVVARLMGLDSLPASTTSEQTSAAVAGPGLIHHSSCQRSSDNFHFEHNIIYDNTLTNVSHPIGSTSKRMHSRSIERFQREMLPPKLARPVPVTHRLLSPINGPGYMPTNVAERMEVTARIISKGLSSTSHDKMSPFRSSVPLQIRNLKQRHEESERGCENFQTSQTIKSLNLYMSRNEHSRENVQLGSRDPQIPYTRMDSRRESKEKLVLIPKRERAKAQRKQGLISSKNNGSINQKEGNETVKLNHLSKTQSNIQKSVHKKSLSSSSDVLKQNNQKQNHIANKNKGPAKAPKYKEKEHKSRGINGSGNANKEIGSLSVSKQMYSMTSDPHKKSYPFNSKPFSQIKQSVKRNDNLVESGVKKDMTHKTAVSVMQNVSTDGYMNWDTKRIVSMDVVSFTFTSPIKKAMPLPMLSDCVAESDGYGSNGSGGELNDLGNSSLASKGLVELIEQKLKELSSRVESSQYVPLDGLNSSSKLQDSPLTLKVRSTTAMEQGSMFLINYKDDISTHVHDISDYVDDMLLQDERKEQPLVQIEENSGNTNLEYERELTGGYVSSISTPEPSFSVGNYGSLINKGSNNSFLSSAHETMSYVTPQKLKAYEVDIELSDSASSTPSIMRNGKDGSSTTTIRLLPNWELEYLGNIISNAKLTLEDLVLEKDKPAVSQELFDQLEYKQIGSFDGDEEFLKIWRKVLFDYVGEYLEEGRKFLSSSLPSSKSLKEWAKWRLTKEELGKEISGLMVDGVVERDMGCGKGRWVDFETEVFEHGIEITTEILSSLIIELVYDWCCNKVGNK